MACHPPEPHASPERRPASADPRSAQLQRLVEQLREDASIPGLAVAVAESNGTPLVAVSGLADLRAATPVTADTMSFVGSVSKNLFAAVVLGLVDEGRLELDDPLSKYVEWPRGDEITVKMLLNHTSGIPEYLVAERFERAQDGGLPVFFRTLRDPTELFSTLPDRAPAFDPGSAQSYSNTNGLLVGEVIRRATAQPLAAVLDERIARPLGLRHMYLYGVATAGRDRARGYSGSERWGAADGELADCSAADEAHPDSADGSVVASAADLLRYHQALRQGKLLSEESWAAMRTVEPGVHNGLGYLIGQGPFGRYEGNVGRSMGHVAANVYYPDHDTFVVIMSNRSDVPLPLQAFLERWFAQPAPSPQR